MPNSVRTSLHLIGRKDFISVQGHRFAARDYLGFALVSPGQRTRYFIKLKADDLDSDAIELDDLTIMRGFTVEDGTGA